MKIVNISLIVISVAVPFYLDNIYRLYAFTYLQISIYAWLGVCKERQIWPFITVKNRINFANKYEIPFAAVAYTYAMSLYGCYTNNSSRYGIYFYAVDIAIYTTVIITGYRRRWHIY